MTLSDIDCSRVAAEANPEDSAGDDTSRCFAASRKKCEDAQSYWDLAVAYMEMGAYRRAIDAFREGALLGIGNRDVEQQIAALEHRGHPTMTTFLEYRIQIGVATNPDFLDDGSPPVLPSDLEARRALADSWRRTAHIVFEPSFDSRITYAIKEQLEEAVSDPDSEGLSGVWQASRMDAGVAFLNRDELLAFLRGAVREKVPFIKPTAYLVSFNSDDLEFLASMNEPPDPEHQAELEAEVEHFLARVGELRPGERYALIVEQI